jgi:hypothetical protein
MENCEVRVAHFATLAQHAPRFAFCVSTQGSKACDDR